MHLFPQKIHAILEKWVDARMIKIKYKKEKVIFLIEFYYGNII